MYLFFRKRKGVTWPACERGPARGRSPCRFRVTDHHHHHLFAQNTIKVNNGYANEQDKKAHCALTSAHNITSTVERNTHSTILGIGVTRNR